MKSGSDTSAPPQLSSAGTGSTDRFATMWLVVLVSLFQFGSAYDVDPNKLEGLARARVEVREAFLFHYISLQDESITRIFM